MGTRGYLNHLLYRRRKRGKKPFGSVLDNGTSHVPGVRL